MRVYYLPRRFENILVCFDYRSLDLCIEALAQKCSVKKMSFNIWQNPQQAPVFECPSLFFNKDTGLKPATLLEKKLRHRCFNANFAKFLRAPIFTEHLRWLVLYLICLQLKLDLIHDKIYF